MILFVQKQLRSQGKTLADEAVSNHSAILSFYVFVAINTKHQ